MSQTPELPDDGALEAVQFCLSIIRNNRTKPEDNAIWSCGTSSKPRITQKVLEACEAALAQSTQSPVEQPPQTVAGDGAFKHPKYTTPELELLIKDLNGIPLYAMEDEKTHWQDGGKFQDRIFEAARKYYIAALTRHEGA